MLLMWKRYGSVFEEKLSFKILRFLTGLDSYIISFAKLAPERLIRSMWFLSPEIALYLYKSTIHLCMEYCCHVLAGGPICYMEKLDKLDMYKMDI